MRKPVIVDTPYPTVWETAKKMGVSRKRTLELIKIADEGLARWQEKRKAQEKRTAEETLARKKRLKTA
jgi:hypothetical protein